MIQGVEIKRLKAYPDERGIVMELVRRDDEIFEEFGQSYVMITYPGIIKAWHYHKKQKDLFVCLKGMIKLVLYDNRTNSPTKGEINQFFLGERNPMLVKIPKEVIHGFKCIGTQEAIVVSFPTNTYNKDDPDEYRLPYHTKQIPYDWDIKMK
ncbi:MAG: dTDP-4-dehydrorhamnose 3,5-epimerase family protein [Nanoarchaeota archaeon]|nr:dTDP-4-dehydrorhamnose 3,5-epimerase family protein [Nanoarchaeota archaeon]